MSRSASTPCPRRLALPPGRLCTLISVVLVLGLLPGASAAAVGEPALDPEQFPLPESLAPNVRFWIAIFSQVSTQQAVLHDERYLDVVYEVVDWSDLAASGLSAIELQRASRKRVRERQDHIAGVLRALSGHGQVEAPVGEVEQIRNLWDPKIGGERRGYLDAAARVRSQTGLRDTFAEAIRISGMFMPGIERVLQAEGVPVEIACMPFVESMFNYRARSKVGASGAWQFTASTGRLFLTIDAAVDERSDVLLAARGAARLLKENFRKLGTWPLALTAYNHGTGGIARAVAKTGTTDIGTITSGYDSRTFGFASRNFYAEFVAAVTVYTEREQHFPGVEPLPELHFDEFRVPAQVSLPRLAQEGALELALLAELNPALSREVGRGNLPVPEGYRLRVPRGRGADVANSFARLAVLSKSDPLEDGASGDHYRVKPGDTLGTIARRFGTSIEALQRANRLADPNVLAVGQRLALPGSQRTATVAAASSQHVVRRGDTLFNIALAYGTSVETLKAINELTSTLIQVGQILLIPGN